MSTPVPNHPSASLLKRFRFLHDLGDDQLQLLARTLRITRAPKHKQLLQLGAEEDFTLLLLKGRLLLIDAAGAQRQVEAGTPDGFEPIAPELPRRFNVISITEVLYLQLDNHLLEELRQANRLQYAPAANTLTLHNGEEAGKKLLELLRDDLQADRLELPSLPQVALRVGTALRDDTSDAKRLAEIIQTDPAITAKLIRTANSAFYGGMRPVQTCTDAVIRLGSKTTYKLVLGFALREVFRTPIPVLSQRMRELWKHSVQISSICFVLAKLTGHFDPEHALLAGLVHDIGLVSILAYSARFPAVVNDAELFEPAIRILRGETGALILSNWNFPDDLVESARSAEDWYRDPAPEPDVCDLVITAQLHSFVDSEQIEHLPKLSELPSFRKLELGALTPNMSLEVLQEAGDQVVRAESLLTS